MAATTVHSATRPASAARKPARTHAKGRVLDDQAVADIADLLHGAARDRSALIEHLHLIQDRFGALRKRHLHALADWHGLAMVEVYEVATFYHHFDVIADDAPAPPATTIRVCESLTCAMAGAEALHAALAQAPAQGVRVVKVPCIGRCNVAPALAIGNTVLGEADAMSVQRALAETARVAGLQRSSVAQDNLSDAATSMAPGHATSQTAGVAAADAPTGAGQGADPLDDRLTAYRAAGGYQLATSLRSKDGAAKEQALSEFLANLDQSGLRGLGGAGFPTGRKWAIVRQQPAPRYLTVNADEGEPGTFKDRVHLENDPHRFLEGVLLAAWAIDAARTYIYLRDEYPHLLASLRREIAAIEAAGLIEPGHIVLRRGAGAYICGEESAMIESLEGKRGLPRHRPPYVAERGLFGRPTLVNNVETLFWLREITEKGGAWFASQGCNGAKGLRSFSVSGRVREPGVKIAPAGITARALIEKHCGGMAEGHRFTAYLPGGASGGVLPASLADIPLDFGTLHEHGCFIGSHAVIVLSDRDDLRAVARNLMQFFEHESCGQCTPCRAGTEKMHQLLQAAHWNLALIAELSQAMRDASICGLGQAAPNPVESLIRHFPELFAASEGRGASA